MVSEVYKKRAHDLVKRAKEKCLVKTYKEFCQTDVAKENELTTEEVAYYISKKDDLECYKKAIEEYEKNPKTYTMEEVKRELGLE